MLFIFRAALVALALVLAAPEAAAQDKGVLALVGGTVYRDPTSPPLADAVVLVSGGSITAVGPRGAVPVPPEARVIDCTGKTLAAGFWNAHVHFTEPVWQNAATAPAAALTEHMQAMLTRWGFTTVWDLGSNPMDTLPLRNRIRKGEVLGPDIFTTGSIFPKGGHPVYLPADLRLPQAGVPAEAEGMARSMLGLGLDGIKLFTGSFMGDKPVVNMQASVAKAAVDVAHAAGKPVFAHPQNVAGVDAVIASGVDVLAHTVPSEAGYSAEQLAKFKAQNIALIPTLGLWTTVVRDKAIADRLVAGGVAQLKAFADNGGSVLFGTDVGFTQLYDTSLDMEFMGRALPPRAVLASLTTNPASYFKAAKKGRLEAGFDADVVVLDGDPEADVRNLAKVAYTLRAGTIIYQRP
jgi:imidazolonepropionase-like amidohydrolase